MLLSTDEIRKIIIIHSSDLAWRIPGTGSLVGCRLWGCTELDTTEATQQQHAFYDVIKYKISLYLKYSIRKINIVYQNF